MTRFGGGEKGLLLAENEAEATAKALNENETVTLNHRRQFYNRYIYYCDKKYNIIYDIINKNAHFHPE
jgi:hypothetical protein